MRIAVSADDASVVYVGMVTDDGTILKSTDGGISFSTVYHNTSRTIVGYDSTNIGGGQGDYNFNMTCDPTNANHVFLVSHVVWRSLDGGVTWSQLTDWPSQLHTDMHGIRFHPVYTTKLFNANDGGVWLSTDDGDNWVPESDGLAATEIYHASQSPIKRDMISIGTQDNGELYYSDNEWKTNRGGDWGAYSAFDYLTNDMVYYDNGNRRPVNGGDTYFGLPDTVTEVLEFSEQINTLGFAGKSEIWRSTDLGSSPPAWTQITSINKHILAIHSSPANSNVLYFVTSNSKLYRSDNALATTPIYTVYSTPFPTPLYANIAAIKNDSNVVYLSCGSKVFRSGDKGATWINVTSNLPLGVNIINMYHDVYSTNEAIYVCSAKAVYYKDSGMTDWQNISYNLPTVADIHDMLIYNPGTAASVLRVAYYGRGVWELPLNTSMPPATDFSANTTVICTGQSVNFTDKSLGSPIAWSWSFPGGTPSTSTLQNPMITYSTGGLYSVTLTATNVNGSSSRTFVTYINVSIDQPVPFSEGFTNTVPPAYWKNDDAAHDGTVWRQSLLTGGFGVSEESAYFDNYNYDANGLRDELRTAHYNLSATHPLLIFDRAYARWSGGYFDTLAVLASTDCGDSFDLLYLKGYSELATAPDLSDSIFVPTATQWKQDTIDLLAYAGQEDVLFAFQNRGHYGQAIYIDNVNISTPLGIDENTIGNGFSAFPNPNSGTFTISFYCEKSDDYNVEIYNSIGEMVYTEKLTNFKGEFKKIMDISTIGKGIYFLNLRNSKGISSKKIIVE